MSESYLPPDFFLPLRKCESLHTVSIVRGISHGEFGPVIRALAALPSLRKLSLSTMMPVADAAALGELTRLTELCARDLRACGTVAAGPSLGRTLGLLTQLVHLEVPQFFSATFDRVEEGVILNAVAEQLTGLQRLQSLSIGTETRPDVDFDRGFDALQALSGLTQLTCPPRSRRHAPGGPGRGSYPQLQHLEICYPVRGAELAATLAPLSGLRERTCGVQLGTDPADDGGSDAAGERAVTAMRVAAQTLAAMPRLAHVSLSLTHASIDTPLGPAIGTGTVLLLPLHNCLTSLFLRRLPLASWGALLPALQLATRLEHLHVSYSRLSESGFLLLLGQHLPGLRRLEVCACLGVSGATAVALAAARRQPLRVRWRDPVLTAEECLAFRAVARVGVTVGTTLLFAA